MAGANIVINQGALTAGVASRSRDDIASGALVQLTNASDNGVRAWRWTILGRPPTSTATLSDSTAPNPSFTPDVVGTYRIRLSVNEGSSGQVDIRTAIVRDANGLRVPAVGEAAESNYLVGGGENADGYTPDLQALLELARAGGGGGGWQEVYTVDFRDLSATDLNTAGSTITIDGVTWQTPSAAVTGDNMSAANTSFGITANGLEVVGARNGLLNPNTITGNVIFASLYDISQNTASPFEADPTREYRFEAYVSSNNAAADTEISGVLAFREGSVQAVSNGLPGDGALHRTTLGYMAAAGAGTLEGAGDTGAGTPARQVYRAADLDTPQTTPNVPILHYKFAGNFTHGGGVWDAGFPGNGDLQFFAISRDATDVENDIVAHPRWGFNIGVGHAASNTNNTFDAVIQQFRILQK